MDQNNFSFLFSLKNNEFLIDNQNVEQFKNQNVEQFKNQNVEQFNNQNYKDNKIVIRTKNRIQSKKKTKKLSIYDIKKKQKKSKGRGLLKQTNGRCQKEEDLN